MFDPRNQEQVDERLGALREYAADIDDLERRAGALKELRDTVITGLVRSGLPTRNIAEAAGLSHVRVAAIANQQDPAA